MQMIIDVPEYCAERGITLNWKNGFEIFLNVKNDAVHLKANSEGLISLANHLLNLAQDKAPCWFSYTFR